MCKAGNNYRIVSYRNSYRSSAILETTDSMSLYSDASPNQHCSQWPSIKTHFVGEVMTSEIASAGSALRRDRDGSVGLVIRDPAAL